MTHTFPLSIFSLGKEVFVGKAKSVLVPGVLGQMQVLSLHTPLITKLKDGDIVIYSEEKKETIPIASGVLEVNPKEVVILVNF